MTLSPQCDCADFESALSDFQDGALPPEAASAMREHLRGCAACAELSALLRVARSGLAELGPVTPPPGWMEAVLARTSEQRRWISWRETCRALGRGFWQPRLAMTFGVVLFAFALGLNVTGVNLRRTDWRHWSPSQLVAGAQYRLDRGVARGARYYDDLKLVYEIQAVLRQSPPRRALPAAPEHRNQSDWPASGTRLLSWNTLPPSPRR